MKTLSIVLLGVALALAIPLDKPLSIESEMGWFVPQLDGTIKWISKKEASLKMTMKETQPQNSSAVKFYLYTNLNPTTAQEIFIDDVEGLSESYFNKSHPTRFVIHGWQSNYLSDMDVQIRSAFLEVGEYNVICVDWSEKADTIDYPASVLRVPQTGKKVAEMIDFLHLQHDLSFNNLKVIGHSLGAHVSGFAGKHVTQGKIHTIIGLDPAFPLYSYNKCNERLCVTDAYYVESIHTDGGVLGFLHPIGKASFYPNGGKSQPGCDTDVEEPCDHLRSYIYYAEAIRNNDFMSVKCSNYQKAVSDECGSTYSIGVKLGGPFNDILANGSYYTPVNSVAPFGKG